MGNCQEVDRIGCRRIFWQSTPGPPCFWNRFVQKEHDPPCERSREAIRLFLPATGLCITAPAPLQTDRSVVSCCRRKPPPPAHSGTKTLGTNWAKTSGCWRAAGCMSRTFSALNNEYIITIFGCTPSGNSARSSVQRGKVSKSESQAHFCTASALSLAGGIVEQ